MMKDIYRAAFRQANSRIIYIGSRVSTRIPSRRTIVTAQLAGQSPEVYAEIRRLEAVQIWCARRGGSPG